METTTSLERELTALAALRLAWRHEADVVSMIDSAMRLLTVLAQPDDPEVGLPLQTEALALAGLIRDVLANRNALRIR